jgi:RNA polymerase sigma-70 factor (ECF subfamily)
MEEREGLAEQFETNRPHLRAVAYRLLGSTSEADDAVQEAWLRLTRADTGGVANLGGWLTTVVARICLDFLRARKARREESLDAGGTGPLAHRAAGRDPEDEALLADAVGLALLVVLDTLAPAERLAFVLHDLFAVPFEEIAPIVERTPVAARKLASRARRRVRGAPASDWDLAKRCEVVEAFLTAARGGDFEALVAVLAPDVLARTDGRPTNQGALVVAKGASTFARIARMAEMVLINGTPGVIAAHEGEGFRIMTFEISDDRITQIDVITDSQRLSQLDLALLAE